MSECTCFISPPCGYCTDRSECDRCGLFEICEEIDGKVICEGCLDDLTAPVHPKDCVKCDQREYT